MFDVGFSELLLVALVALVVIGPERLPKAARVAGMWVGRARRTLATVKAEIDRELRAQELNEILNRQAQGRPAERIIEEQPPVARPGVESSASSTPISDPDRPPPRA